MVLWFCAIFIGCKKPPEPVVTVPPPVRHAIPGHEPPAIAPTPQAGRQAQRWASAKIKPSVEISVNKMVMTYLRTRARYEAVENVQINGVPAPVIFGLHMRESDNSFGCHLHEGSSLLHRTRFVPKGRLPPPDDPPYQWEHSAQDAIYVCDRLQGNWTDLTWSLDRCESYNGLGYRRLGVPSPYLWSGTDQYRQGKYTSDGHFSESAIDQQLGVACVLLRMKEKGIVLKFSP